MRDLVTDFFGHRIPFWLPAWMVALPVAYFKLGGGGRQPEPAPQKPAPPPTPPAASAATASTRALIRDIASLRSRSSTVLMHRSRDVLRPGSSGWAPPGSSPGSAVTPPVGPVFNQPNVPTESGAPTGGSGPVDALPTSPWNPNGSTPPVFGAPIGSLPTGGSSNSWFTPPAIATQPQLPPSIYAPYFDPAAGESGLQPVGNLPAYTGGYNYGGGASSVIERTTGDTLFPDLLQVVTGRENDQDHSVYLER